MFLRNDYKETQNTIVYKTLNGKRRSFLLFNRTLFAGLHKENIYVHTVERCTQRGGVFTL